MRAILVLTSCLATTVLAAPTEVIDLTKPGALEQVAKDNPQHYAQIVAIIRVAEQHSCEQALKLYRANFAAASNIDCLGLVILTSDPPKHRLGFTLDTTRYVTVVTIKTPKGKLIPVK